MDKKKILKIAIISVIILIFLFSHHLRYLFSNGKDISIHDPDCYIYYSDESEAHNIIDEGYELNELMELEEEGYDKENHIYHIFTSAYMIKQDVRICGVYRNYPFKPIVKIDGLTIKKVGCSNWERGGLFSNAYFRKEYHFDLENIKAEHVYTIEIICGKRSVVFKVVFHF